MKKLDNYQRCVNKLVKIVRLANEQYFNGELPEVTVSLQESVKAYGSITTSECWFTADGTKAMKELNISSVYLTRNIEEIVCTILHELSHLALMVGFGGREPDPTGGTSNNYYYHTKTFKDMAEQVAKIHIEKHDKYGFTLSSPTEETLDFCIRNDLSDFEIARSADWSSFFVGGDGSKSTTTDKPKITRKPRNNSRKWVCPGCGQIIRSTRDDTNVICGDCNEKFVRAD